MPGLRRFAPLALAVAAVCALGASAALAKAPQSCNGERSLCSRHFNKVVLPATHNSMSAASLGWAIPNQPNTIADQLHAGIRGLLLDTHYGRLQPDGTVITDDGGHVTTGKLGLYPCHDVCQIGASPLVPQLEAIRRFLERSPNNVLLLDVEDYITPQDFASALKQSGLLHYERPRALGSPPPAGG